MINVKFYVIGQERQAENLGAFEQRLKVSILEKIEKYNSEIIVNPYDDEDEIDLSITFSDYPHEKTKFEYTISSTDNEINEAIDEILKRIE